MTPMATPIYQSLTTTQKLAILHIAATSDPLSFPEQYATMPTFLRPAISMVGDVAELCEGYAKQYKNNKSFQEKVDAAYQRELDAFPPPGPGIWG